VKIRRLIELSRETSTVTSPLSHGGRSGNQPLYLPRAFKSAVGQSPHQYVLARRIERARDLLRNTDSPIVKWPSLPVSLRKAISVIGSCAPWDFSGAYRRQSGS